MNDLTEYKKIRKYFKNGDRLGWHSDRPLGGLIRFATGEEENHTSQVVRIPFMENRVFSIEALDDGLHLWPLSDLLARHPGWCNWYPLKEEYQGDLAIQSTRWLFAHLGRPYDWHSCISHWRSMIGLEPKLADDKYLYCSESQFLSWQDYKFDEAAISYIGAGLPALKHIKISPVPGDPMQALGLWRPTEARLIEAA